MYEIRHRNVALQQLRVVTLKHIYRILSLFGSLLSRFHSYFLFTLILSLSLSLSLSLFHASVTRWQLPDFHGSNAVLTPGPRWRDAFDVRFRPASGVHCQLSQVRLKKKKKEDRAA